MISQPWDLRASMRMSLTRIGLLRGLATLNRIRRKEPERYAAAIEKGERWTVTWRAKFRPLEFIRYLRACAPPTDGTPSKAVPETDPRRRALPPREQVRAYFRDLYDAYQGASDLAELTRILLEEEELRFGVKATDLFDGSDEPPDESPRDEPRMKREALLERRDRVGAAGRLVHIEQFARKQGATDVVALVRMQREDAERSR